MALKQRMLIEQDWSQPGSSVEGYLLKVTPVKYRDGGVGAEYLLRKRTGSVLSFKGSAQLNKLLHPSDAGCYVVVKYIGEDRKDVPDGMSPRKNFEVQIDEDDRMPTGQAGTTAKRQQSSDGTEITDDDIPF